MKSEVKPLLKIKMANGPTINNPMTTSLVEQNKVRLKVLKTRNYRFHISYRRR